MATVPAASVKPSDANQAVPPADSCWPAWAYLMLVLGSCAVVAFWRQIVGAFKAVAAWVRGLFRRGAKP